MTEVMYCYRPKEVERCNGTQCPYEHRWETVPDDEVTKIEVPDDEVTKIEVSEHD